MWVRVMDWWHARQRSIDLQVLWPACKANAKDIDHAKAAFAVHAFNDRAWVCLSEEEIKRRIDAL
jgi:hypothetical protein